MKIKKQTKGFHLSSDNDYNIVPYPFSGLYEHLMYIENYSCMYIDNENVYILESDLSTYFEPLENFKEFQIMGKKNKVLTLGQRNYFLKNHDNLFITVDKEIVDDGWTIEQTQEVEEMNEALEESKSRKISRIYYKEENEKIQEIVNLFNKIFIYESPLKKKAKVSVVINTPQGYQLKTAQIKPKPIDLDKHYNDDFKKIHKAIMDCFTDSKKGIALLHGSPGTGKLQPFTEPILTPDGWTLMGNIEKGSKVICPVSGDSVEVLDTYRQKDLNIYKVSFNDDTWMECCNEHLFRVYTMKGLHTNKYQVLSLQEIMDKGLRTNSNGFRYSIPCTEPVIFKENKITLHPYLLGVLLGDGYIPEKYCVSISCSIHTVDEYEARLLPLLPYDVTIKRSNRYGNVIRLMFNSEIKKYLKDLNLLGKKSRDKFIPQNYLINSLDVRKELLSGLLDTDGCCEVFKNKKKCRYSTMSPFLKEGFIELVRGLGGIAKVSEDRRKKYKGGIVYNISLRIPFNPFKLTYKKENFDSFEYFHKFVKKIVGVEYLRKDEGQCIRVDSEHSLYITRGYNVTHNTNYIKNLTKMAPDKNFIYIPSNMIGFITDPSFIGQMIEYKDSVLIIEDCEKYIQDRKNDTGNNNFVSTLLNLSDGILSDMMDLQIICTFNNDLGDIDSALLRKGRLIAEYEFKALTKDKADRLLKELNYMLEEGKESTLANIYNANVMEFVEGSKKQNKIGFR